MTLEIAIKATPPANKQALIIFHDRCLKLVCRTYRIQGIISRTPDGLDSMQKVSSNTCMAIDLLSVGLFLMHVAAKNKIAEKKIDSE